jgi:Flp pilus assembly protein TadG
MNLNNRSVVTRGRDSQCGQSIVVILVFLVVLLALAAFVIDMGNLYFSYQELQNATQAAALAGAIYLPDEGQATAMATKYGAGAGNLNAKSNLQNVTMVANYPMLKCLATSGVPCLPAVDGSSPPTVNAIVVQEQATVPTYFAKVFGVNTVTLTATATASAKGGIVGTYSVMMVLDTTRSMSDTVDSTCVVPGLVTGTVTPEQCAQYGVQVLMGELAPCPVDLSSCGTATNGLYPNSVDEVGLIVFPGLTPSETTTLTTPPVAAATAVNDYNCSGTNPSITTYNNNPAYMILPFQSDFRTSAAASTLNTSSHIVSAVGGGGSSCPGAQAPGGEGTFYAGAIATAQSYLLANTRSNAQNVMIILSDGNATASAAQMAGTATSYSPTAECQQAVTAATNAKNAGILIYSVSYGSETSGCTTGDTLTPCETMESMASTPTAQYFFSVPKVVNGVTSTVCSGARPDTALSQVFKAIGRDLTTGRLIPNGTQ